MTPKKNVISRYWDLLLPIVLAPLIWWTFHATRIDKWLIDIYYDPVERSFPLRNNAFMEDVMHSGLKMMVVAIGIAVLGAFILSYVVPQLPRQRRRLLWLFFGMAGAALLVSTIKHNSTMHCPWDLAEYGGYAPFHELFDRLPDNISPGHCFPGGHASGGFALLAFYFALRDTNRVAARLCLAGALTLGTIMGWAQMMRGAHFLSHTVWSAWVEWTFLALLYHLVRPHNEKVPVGS